MNKDMLVVLGVVIIVVGILGYFYYNVSKGVAPSLLKEERVQTGQAGQSSGGGKKVTKTTTGQSTGSSSSGSPPDFASLFLKTREFKATYDYYVGKTKKGQITYYIKGDKRRMDVSTDQGKIISIHLKDKMIFCMKQKENSQWLCYSLNAGQKPPQQQGQGGSAEDPVEVSQEKFTKPVYNGTRKIAGKTCHCYYVKTTETQQGKNYKVTYEICVTTDGIFAYFYYKAMIGNQASVYWMILRSYSTKVSDIAFNPPAQPQEFPTSSP